MLLFRTTRRRAAWSATLIGAVACSALLTASPATAQNATVAPPPKPVRLDYKENRLKNGLKIVTLEDHRAPVVTLQVWYHVGSKDEPAGRGGFAHLFEHLMFKGGKAVGPQQHALLVEALGADYNADTGIDRTRYYETVRANALDRVLFLEADRMTSLRVDEANLKSERDVVKEEYRFRIQNAPYGHLLIDVLQSVYPATHPYFHPSIGSLPDLDAAQLTDVQQFRETYYKPDNATLVLVGDFKTSDALEKIEKYFGAIPKSATGVFPRLPDVASDQTASKKATFYDPLAPLPAVGLAFRLPPPSDPDTPVFEVISLILSSGKGSRLYRSLVRDQQLAVAAQGGSLDLLLGGTYFFFGIANGGKKPEDVTNALRAEVEKLRSTPVTTEELTKAKNQALTAQVFGNISTEEKANALGEADLLYGTPDEANKAYDKLVAITAADVQRVAQKYFAPERSSEFYVLPASMKPKTDTAPTNVAPTKASAK